MSEPRLGVVEDTLFVPMLGRIYASENCRDNRRKCEGIERGTILSPYLKKRFELFR